MWRKGEWVVVVADCVCVGGVGAGEGGWMWRVVGQDVEEG
jgi:hypothetical protein